MAFKIGSEPGEATSTDVSSSMVTDHASYIKVIKSPQYGTGDSHIVNIVN